MSGLFINTLKFLGRCVQGILLYAHAQRADVRKGTGFLHALFTGKTGRNTGARFLSESEQLKILSPGNKGLLIDGKGKRLTLEESFKHLLVVAPTGTGKTSKFVIPNVLALAQDENSIIVTDPSGEIFAQTSGYLQSKGFKVLKFDPTDPERSIYFNPLRYIFSYADERTEIDPVKVSLLATSLVASSLKDPQDAFWKAGAESLIEFFTHCLRRTPKAYHNLYNVYKLAEAMTPDGSLLDNFMVSYVQEQHLKDKWLSLISNANPTIQSQITTVQTALKSLANERLAKILSKNSIRFSDLKKEKTILYLTFPVNEASVYTFVLNLFYTLLFHFYMESIPKKEDLPLFILYDEFGHANIPDFDMVITNMRKYKVSLSLVLQSFSQLDTQYGQEKANTIIEGGVNSKLFFSGTSQKTAQAIERMLGKVIRQETYHTNTNEEITSRNEFNLLNADEIRTLPDNQAIFLTGNKNPILLETLPYFKNPKFKNKPKLGEAYISANTYYRFELMNILDEV
jgi:type IV secretory pathway TraG/TraD family ATPase VirD4